ncbi:MAG TPA: SCP2 sterol-binding domain-containing protein [Melioribacteraceae bacterium]|nr:SCP2 sterol-binding domain-containing protein [Melioribacteraceae bacterium]
MEYFSGEWAAQLCKSINNNQEYKNSSEGWKWKLILNQTGKTGLNPVFLDLNNGECREARIATGDDFNISEFIIEADKETWERILNKSLSPMQALMTKKLSITKGNMSDLLPYVNSLKELLNSAMKIE